MKKKFKKVVAAASSAAMIASVLGALHASAIDMSYGVGKNSKMRYTIYTTKESDSQVRLHVKITNNPGITGFSFTVIGSDGTAAAGNGSGKWLTMPSGFFGSGQYNNENKMAFMTGIFNAENKDDFEFSFLYDVDKSASATQTFQAGVTYYYSQAEDITYNNRLLASPDATVKISTTTYVKLGDLDNSGTVDPQDAYYETLLINSASNKKISTTVLDTQLKNTSSTWHKNFPNLKCAAVADIDHNETIEQADLDELLQYQAEVGAGTTVTNKEINTLLPVTVVYDK